MGQDRDGCGQTGESEAERFTASSRGRCQFAPEKFDKVIHELTLALNHENCPHPNPLPSEWARGFLGSFVTLARFAGEGRVRALSSRLFSKELGRRHRSTERQVPLTVATAEAPMRKESSGLSTLIRIGKRAASRIQSSERSTRGSPLTLVPFSGSTAQPNPTTVPRKCLLGCDCR